MVARRGARGRYGMYPPAVVLMVRGAGSIRPVRSPTRESRCFYLDDRQALRTYHVLQTVLYWLLAQGLRGVFFSLLWNPAQQQNHTNILMPDNYCWYQYLTTTRCSTDVLSHSNMLQETNLLWYS